MAPYGLQRALKLLWLSLYAFSFVGLSGWSLVLPEFGIGGLFLCQSPRRLLPSFSFFMWWIRVNRFLCRFVTQSNSWAYLCTHMFYLGGGWSWRKQGNVRNVCNPTGWKLEQADLVESKRLVTIRILPHDICVHVTTLHLC